MRVFLFNSKILSSINRKEEITDDTYLITDKEAELIQFNLDNDGYFWIDENKQLRVSGKKPNNYSYWDEINHLWVEDKNLKERYMDEKKELIWEEIKKQREFILQSGVKLVINKEPKWFHTDIISQQSYDRAKEYLKDRPEETIPWKTMDNSFVNIDYSVLKKLTDNIFLIGQKVFQIAEEKRINLIKISEPELLENFNIKDGWVEVFDNP